MVPGRHTHARVTRVYSRDHALRVVRAAIVDYEENFGGGSDAEDTKDTKDTEAGS
jgi:hypothetical protein